GPSERATLKQTILDATTQVGRPTLFSMLIIIIAHVPIFTLQRQEGRIFAPMAYTVTSALVGSLLFSLTLVPLLCFFLLRKRLPEKENFLVLFCKRLYRPVLKGALNHPLLVMTLALALLGVTVALSPRLGTEFLPELNEGTLWVNLNLPPGISVSEAQRNWPKARPIIRQFPEVNSVVSQAGRPEDGTDPKPINMAEFFVDVKPPEQWTRPITKEQLTADLEHALDVLPGVEVSMSQPI